MSKMMNILRQTLLLAAIAAGLSACMREPSAVCGADASGDKLFNADGTLSAVIRAEIPDMPAALTRTLDNTPDYADLSLYALVFEEGEGLRQYARLDREDALDADGEHGHAELLTFKIALEPTEKTATLHLVATNQPGFEEQIVYGTEERVVTALYTDDGHEAYWQRIVFESNIPGKEQTDPANAGNSDPFKRYDPEAAANAAKIRMQLTHVPLVRNFCRVSVDASAAYEKDRFTLTGLYVLNTVDRGSVAPYVTTAQQRRFVDGYCTIGPDGKYRSRSYDDISATGHIGSLPTGVQLINKAGDDIATKSESLTGEPPVAPVCFFERPARVNSTERTFAILRGHRPGDSDDSFYKVDLGYIDQNFKDENNHDAVVGRFEYYNLLRNFDFRIRLNSVTEQGYASLEDAAKGVVFNNFSASVEARTMTSISDGDDMIFVKFFDPVKRKDIFFTSYVFTRPGEIIHLKSQYRIDIETTLGGEVHNELIRVKFDPNEDDPGVIAGIRTVHEDADAAAEAEDEWNEYEVTGGEPTDLLRQQSVYVYRGERSMPGQTPEYGLYRVITFFSHTPWPFVHMDTFPGLGNDFDEAPWDWSNEWREVGQSAGSPLTLFFELPAGLPQALFPLEFVIESDRQNIQNAYVGNAAVRSVPAAESLFYAVGAADNPTTSRIQYVKTVTWADYYGEYSEEQIGTGSSVVRCRFLTITDLAQDGIGVPDEDGNTGDSKSQTRLRVANPYFGVLQSDGSWQMYHEDGFERATRTSDPTPRLWNFSDLAWSSVMAELTGNRSARINRTVDGLLLYENGTYSLSGGTHTEITDNSDPENPVTETYSYIQTSSPGTANSSNSGDRFQYKHDYPASQEREIRLAVMATDANGQADKDNLLNVIVENTGGSVTLQRGYPIIDESTKPFPTLVFQYDVAASTRAVTFTVKPKSNAATRFYKMDFYPRWDEINTASAAD